jgi:hypothetical protein
MTLRSQQSPQAYSLPPNSTGATFGGTP